MTLGIIIVVLEYSFSKCGN